MVPSGWHAKPLADIVREKISYGIVQAGPHVLDGIPYIKSSDVRGAINPETLQRTSREIHFKYRRSSVHPGDIVFSLRGNIGELAIVPDDLPEANLTQGTARIAVSEDQCNQFHYYQLASEKILNRINTLSKGSTFKEISLEELRKVKVLCAPIEEQKKIAKILSVWDKAITTTEQLLANSQQQKKALMQKLLTGKVRLLDENGVRFEGGWDRLELGELLDYVQPTPYLVKSTEYSDEYETPVLTAGKTFILGYTNEEFGIYKESLPAIIFDDFTTDNKFVDFPFKAKSSAMKILTAKNGVSIKYVFEAMQMLDFAIGGHQRHWISIYSNLTIPVPKEEEQQKIADVLSMADQEIYAFQNKLKLLQQEKKALMQQLLTGKRRVLIN
ncbi:restriction endonuclease subunit S [Cellvibrio sp. OA-2007]|uniref:restriction endonuclease subunit S n=1 Tax=Cellvibrio sp. OA-2007 TaxID=529823 RepID=UPI00078161E5|nr:restriction endonuclease subunit S [Cellvibrio sp. OA-2007]